MSLLVTLPKPYRLPPPRFRLPNLPHPAVQSVAFNKSHYVTGDTVTATIAFTRPIATSFGAVAPKLVITVDGQPLELSGTTTTATTLIVQGVATEAMVATAGRVTWGVPNQILPFWKGTLAGNARVKITSNDGWSMNNVVLRWIDGAVTTRQAPMFVNPVPSLPVPVHERISCYYGESNQYWWFVNYPDMPFHPGLDFDTDDDVQTPCVAAHDCYIIAQSWSSRGWTVFQYIEDGGRYFVLHYTHLIDTAFGDQDIPWNFSDRSRPVSGGAPIGNIARIPGYEPLPKAHLHAQLGEYDASGNMIAASLDPAPHFGIAPRTTLEVNAGWTEYTIKLPLLDTAGTLTRQATVREILTMIADRYGGNAGLLWIRATPELLSGDPSAVLEGNGSITLKGYLAIDGLRVIANSPTDIRDAANGRPADLTLTNQIADLSGLSFN